jgi:anti-sigma factor RsiW
MGSACRQVEDGLSRFVDGESVGAERERIAAHLQGCESCREEAAAFRAIDRAVAGALSRHPFDRALARKIAESAERARGGGRGRVVPAPARAPWVRRAGAVAAAAAVLVAGGLFIRAALERGGPEVPRAAEIATVRGPEGARIRVLRTGAIGESLTVAPGGAAALREGDRVLVERAGAELLLRDGTRVLVRPDTQVEVREALVALVGGPGELYCEVPAGPVLRSGAGGAREAAERLPGRRFAVETPMARAEVLGTKFGVCVLGGDTIVTVVEGRVRVIAQTDRAAIELAADERVRVGARTGMRVEGVNARGELRWTMGGEEPLPAPAGRPEEKPRSGRPAPPVQPVPRAEETPGPPPVDLPIGPR